MWFDYRMWYIPETTCSICAKNHYDLYAEMEPEYYPLPVKIVDAAMVYIKSNDKCGLSDYAASLYHGNGTNYIPAIALSGWVDRVLHGNLESASVKYTSLIGHVNMTKQIFLLNREIIYDNKLIWRLHMKGGTREMTRRNDRIHDYGEKREFNNFSNFIQSVPPIFTTNHASLNNDMQSYISPNGRPYNEKTIPLVEKTLPIHTKPIREYGFDKKTFWRLLPNLICLTCFVLLVYKIIKSSKQNQF